MLLNPVTLHRPKTITEASQLLQDLSEVKIVAGGSFALNNLKYLKTRGLKTPTHLLCLNGVKDLYRLEIKEQHLIIGSMVSITTLLESPLISLNLPLLTIIARNISTTPIRNMATIGGNLTCRYTWTELPVAMLLLDAEFHFQDKNATTVIKAVDFFANLAKTNALLTHLAIPLSGTIASSYQRVRKMSDIDQPLLSLGIKTKFKDGHWTNVRVAVNTGVQFALRDNRLEQYLEGKSQVEINEALNQLSSEIYDIRSTPYKQHMFRTCIKMALEDLIGQKDKS